MDRSERLSYWDLVGKGSWEAGTLSFPLMGGGDQILERATPARSCASVPVVGLLRLLFIARGSLWACQWAVGLGSQVGLRGAGNSLGLSWASWRDLSGPVASYILSTWREPCLCKAGHPGHTQVLLGDLIPRFPGPLGMASSWGAEGTPNHREAPLSTSLLGGSRASPLGSSCSS